MNESITWRRLLHGHRATHSLDPSADELTDELLDKDDSLLLDGPHSRRRTYLFYVIVLLEWWILVLCYSIVGHDRRRPGLSIALLDRIPRYDNHDTLEKRDSHTITPI